MTRRIAKLEQELVQERAKRTRAEAQLGGLRSAVLRMQAMIAQMKADQLTKAVSDGQPMS